MRIARPTTFVLVVVLTMGSSLASPPVLQVGGEPYFPLGWYDSRGFGSSAAAATAAYAEYPSAGMNTVLFAYGSWSNQGASITSALEAASANGLKLMFEIDRNAVRQQPGYPLSLIDEQVDLAKSHPALLGYYLMDEPELQGVTPSMLQGRYAQIKARDPVHPIFVVHHHTTSYLSSEPPPYTDVLMSDTYVVRKARPEFGDDLWTVAQHARINAQQAESHGKQAYVNVVQTHDTTNETGFRPPTFGEQRYISYAPIVQGARGLLYWMHYYTTQDYRTNVVGPIASQIESLVPAIISNSTAVSVSSNRDGQSTHGVVGDISYLFGQDETGGYLIAVNNTASALSVQFTLEGPSLLDFAPVLSESRMVTLQDLGGDTSVFTDSFTRFDVNVYRIAVPEPATGTLFMVLLGMGLLRRGASNHHLRP